MKSSKLQHPSSREIPTSKFRSSTLADDWIWSLNIGASLEFGAWNLELSKLLSFL
jgi:hypothetical protein